MLSRQVRQATPDVTSGSTGDKIFEWLAPDLLREADKAEKLRIQILNCPSNWHRQWRSEIDGFCRQNTWLPFFEKQRD